MTHHWKTKGSILNGGQDHGAKLVATVSLLLRRWPDLEAFWAGNYSWKQEMFMVVELAPALL